VFFYPNKPIEIFDPEGLLKKLGNLTHWRLQPKWNGKRIEIHCNGEVRTYSREKREWYLDEWKWLSELPLPKPWFLDGELLRDGRIYVWDYALIGGEMVFKTEYGPRIQQLKGLSLSKNGLVIECVKSLPATEYEVIMSQKDDEFLEGMVWKNLKATNMWGPHRTNKVSSQFKYRF